MARSSISIFATLAAFLFATAGFASVAADPVGPLTRAGGYDPTIDPADFVRRVTNDYFPLTPGATLVYEGTKAGKMQRDTFVVTRKTRTILGVVCTVVRDTVTLNGRPVERTFDWYAQDKAGNVWYFGEDSRDFVGGRWRRSDGSWEAGVDGAKPGIVMQARLRPGRPYRQEYYPGYAEDMARVLGMTASVAVPYGVFERVLVTREWTPLEPGTVERKYYARGLGEIKSVIIKGGSEEMELVAVPRT